MRIELRVPGPDGTVIVVQHPDQSESQVAGLVGVDMGVGAIEGAGGGQPDLAEIRTLARTEGGMGDVELGSDVVPLLFAASGRV